MEASERLSSAVCTIMREAIEETGGNEVFFLGFCNDDGLVEKVSIGARGARHAVPAIMALANGCDVLIHNHPSSNLEPSEADLSIAYQAGNDGMGFYIVDSAVENLYAVVDPHPEIQNRPVDADELTAMLTRSGALGRTLPHYEPREGQIALLDSIAGAFNRDEICIAEAGTGIGKSFAYLIPAFAWVIRNKERIVISTGTINLQQQLLEKDIPAVQKAFREPVKAVLVIGRQNYLCRNRLDEAVDDAGLFIGDDEGLGPLKEWAATSPTGRKSDVPFPIPESLWSGINADPDTCAGLRCPQREKCFVIQARKEAAAARILVVNHHLLFSDLSIRHEGAGFEGSVVLPPFRRIIFDEAHNIERDATSFFSESLSRFSVEKQLGRIYRSRKGKPNGLLIFLERKKLIADAGVKIDVLEALESVRSQIDEMDQLAIAFMGNDNSYRLPPGYQENRQLADYVLAPMSELGVRLFDLIHLLQSILDESPLKEDEDQTLFELRNVVRRLEVLAGFCQGYTRYQEREDTIFYLERGRTRSGVFVRFIQTPLDIAPILEEAVFRPFPTVICVSATLAINESFAFWKSRVGLANLVTGIDDPKTIVEMMIPSPFPYKDRVLLGIPSDMPSPDQAAYLSQASRIVIDLVKLTSGRALLLFTSYDAMKKTYEMIAPELTRAGIPVLLHGEADRTILIDRFRSQVGSVLLGTDSFWEGVDVPGEALEMVIIFKLPFPVPSEPIFAARDEFLRRKGRSSFAELSLPQAVMKLKQGFGRLMRRTSDRGLVVVLDNRLVTKSYGQIFLKSLPPASRTSGTAKQLLEQAENFLFP